jgi:hypothetical protein
MYIMSKYKIFIYETEFWIVSNFLYLKIFQNSDFVIDAKT